MNAIALNVKPEAVVSIFGLPYKSWLFATASSVAVFVCGDKAWVSIRPCYMRTLGGTVYRAEHIDAFVDNVSFSEVDQPGWWKDRSSARSFLYSEALPHTCKCGHHRGMHLYDAYPKDGACNHDGCKCRLFEEVRGNAELDSVPKVRPEHNGGPVSTVPKNDIGCDDKSDAQPDFGER